MAGRDRYGCHCNHIDLDTCIVKRDNCADVSVFFFFFCWHIVQTANAA